MTYVIKGRSLCKKIQVQSEENLLEKGENDFPRPNTISSLTHYPKAIMGKAAQCLNKIRNCSTSLKPHFLVSFDTKNHLERFVNSDKLKPIFKIPQLPQQMTPASKVLKRVSK